jgi:hypothetical protein
MIFRRFLCAAAIYATFSASLNYYVDNDFNVTIHITKDIFTFVSSSSLAYLCYIHLEGE